MNNPITAEALAAAPLGSIVFAVDPSRPIACKLDEDEQPWHAADFTEGGATYFGDAKLADYLAKYYPGAALYEVRPDRPTAAARPGPYRAEALARAVEWANGLQAPARGVVEAATAFEAFLSGTTAEARA